MADIATARDQIMIHPVLGEVLCSELCPANWKGSWQDAHRVLKSCIAFANSAALPAQERPPESFSFCHGPEYSHQYYRVEQDNDCVAKNAVFGVGMVWWNDVQAYVKPTRPGTYAMCFRYAAMYRANPWKLTITCPKVGNKGGALLPERQWVPMEGQEMRWYVIPDIEIPPEIVGQTVTLRMWDHGSGHSGEKWDCAALVPIELLDLTDGKAKGAVTILGRTPEEDEAGTNQGQGDDDWM